MDLRKLYDNLHATDIATWLGHGCAGFAISFVLGPAATFAAFAYREGSDMLAWWRDERPQWEYDTQPPPNAFKKRFGPAAKDSFFDLWAPMLGALAAELVKVIA
jgi:hypothetical protein